MSKGNTFENDLVKLIFQATAIANLADNAASNPNTQLILGLHFADPGEAGTLGTSEATYTGYLPAAVARTSGGWTVSNNQASNAAQVQWPASTGGVATGAYFSVAVTTGASAKILYSGQLTSPLAITNGITPTAAIGALTITED
jgi:hypothetical protein